MRGLANRSFAADAHNKELSFVEIQMLQEAAKWEMLLLTVIVVTTACLMQVTSHTSLRALDQLLLPKPRLALYKLLRLFVLYVLLHALMLWIGHVGLPQLIVQFMLTQLPTVIIALAAMGAVIAICWVILRGTKRRVNFIFISLLYAGTACLLFFYFGSKYSLVFLSGTATWHDYVFQPYALLILLLLYTLSVYGKRRIRMNSLPVLTADQLQGQPLELLYTLRRDQQILRHSQELDLYYVHDVSLNLYYPYRIQEVSKLPKAKRRTSGHTQDAEAKPLSRVQSRAKKYRKLPPL